MKKIIGLSLAFIFALTLTGCGDKKLTCTNKETTESYSSSTTIEMVYKKDNIKNYSLKVDMDLGEDMIDFADYIVASYDSTYGQFNGIKGVNYSTKKDGNKLSLNFSVNYSKVNSEDKEKFSDIDKGLTIEDAKSNYESIGYECK